MHQVEFTLVARNGSWRAEIFRRADGTYGFCPYRWSNDERCWIQVPGGHFAESFTSTAEVAESEARARVPQLGRSARKVFPSTPPALHKPPDSAP